MTFNTSQIITMTEANQNFSKAVKAAETSGTAIIFKNNRPRYMLVDLEKSPLLNLTDDEKIDIAAKRVLEKYRPALKELAK